MTTPQKARELVERLRECPFCGGEARIETRPSYSQAASTYEAHRGWCDHCGFGLDWHGHEAEAIAAWNRRATPQDQAGDGWRDIASAPRDGTVVQVLGITDDERDDAEDDEREPRPMPYPCYVSVQPALFWIVGAGLRNVHEDDCVGWRPLPAAPARTALGMGGEVA